MYEVLIGRFSIRILFRQVSKDEGITLHVIGPTPNGREEVLRFDCFKNRAHYHLGYSYLDKPLFPIESEDPLSWTLGQLKTNFNELLSAAAACQLDDKEMSELEDKLKEVSEFGNKLTDEFIS